MKRIKKIVDNTSHHLSNLIVKHRKIYNFSSLIQSYIISDQPNIA